MLNTVFTKAVRDGWLAPALAAVVLGGFLVFAMFVYRDLDLSVYRDLPRDLRDFMGLGDVEDAAALAYGAGYSFMGALTIAGVAIARGAAAIAGEERDGTMGLLLSNPVSRGKVLIEKAASMVLLIGVAALILWGAGVVAPHLANVGASGNEVGALTLHMFANALFYGFLALMIGAWTGNGTAAWGGAAAIMAVSYFASGLLPLVKGAEDLAKLFPWYYYDGSGPLSNGINWGHLAVLFGGSALFGLVALAGFNRRDLTERSAGVGLADRLRNQRLTQRVFERLEGSTRVSRIAIKTTSEYQGLLMVTGLIVLLFGVLIGPIFPIIEEDMAQLLEDYPASVLAIVGNADMSTPEGWYTGENFSLVHPIGFLLVLVVLGGRAIGGEEQRRTMGLLLANPISRSRVVIEKGIAMAIYAAILGVLAFAGTVAGSLLGGLGISVVNIAAISLLLTLLGLAFGALSLALSAATGRVGISTYGTAGIALIFFLLNAYLPLSDSLEGFARLSPFYYYLTGDPLANGLDWGHAGLLAALTLVLFALSIVLFNRRDIRQ